MKDNVDTDPGLQEVRYRSKRNQSTLNIELGLSKKQTSSSSTSAGAGAGTSTGGVVGGLTGGTIPPSGACFVAGTQISVQQSVSRYDSDMGAYSTLIDVGKNIELVEVGDTVKAFLVMQEYDSMKPIICSYQKVLHCFVHKVTDLLRLDFSGGSIFTTPEHKFLRGRQFVEAASLAVGDNLVGLGTLSIIAIHSVIYPNGINVYNFEVETCHTYFANGCAVSNVKRNDGDLS